jgi:hypothetical protein
VVHSSAPKPATTSPTSSLQSMASTSQTAICRQRCRSAANAADRPPTRPGRGTGRQGLGVELPDRRPLERRVAQVGGGHPEAGERAAEPSRPDQVHADGGDRQPHGLQEQQQPRVGPDPVQGGRPAPGCRRRGRRTGAARGSSRRGPGGATAARPPGRRRRRRTRTCRTWHVSARPSG